jgi:pectate lyase
MANKIKFTREFNPGYAGAEGWGESADGYAENPYFGFYDGTDEIFDVIIDKSGVTLYGEGNFYYTNNQTYSAWTAGAVAKMIEDMDADEFVKFVKETFEFNEE